MRKHYETTFKAKVAIEALRGEKTIQEIASQYQVHPNMVTQWKKHLSDQSAQIFDKTEKAKVAADEAEKKLNMLYQQIGQLQVENDFLKKKYKQLYGSVPVL